MNLAVTLDDAGGMMFNHRRQSRDRTLLAELMDTCKGKSLYIYPYSESLLREALPEDGPELIVSEHALEEAGDEDWVFVEDRSPLPFADRIQTILVYKWNRPYPADLTFDIPLGEWTLSDITEFEGSSHDVITREVFIR